MSSSRRPEEEPSSQSADTGAWPVEESGTRPRPDEDTVEELDASEEEPSSPSADTGAWPVEESGTRPRPDEDTVEELDASELELVEDDAPSPPPPLHRRPPPLHRRPAPPPRREPGRRDALEEPAPALAPTEPHGGLRVAERVDLDAIVEEAERAPRPAIPIVPSVVPSRRPRFGWQLAVTLASSAVAVGALAFAIIVARDSRRAPDPVVSPAPAEPVATPTAEERAVPRAGEPRAPEPPAFELAAPAAEPPSTVVELHPAEPSDARPARGRSVSRARAMAMRRAAHHAAPAAAKAAPWRARARRAGPRPVLAEPAREPSSVEPPDDEAPTEPTEPSQSQPSAAAGPAPDEGETPSAPSELPEQPSRADVERAIRSVLPALRACAAGVGVVELELHFAPNGRATVAEAHGSLATPAQRSCIARAARAARVPPFSGPHLTVRYPASL